MNWLALSMVIILVIILAFIIGFTISFASKLNKCNNSQSVYCYALLCPNIDPTAVDPCSGYAQRTDDSGRTICAL